VTHRAQRPAQGNAPGEPDPAGSLLGLDVHAGLRAHAPQAGWLRPCARRRRVLTVIGGRSAAGQSAAASHTAAAATQLVTQEALFG